MKTADNKAFWQRFAKLYTKAMVPSAGMYDQLCKLMLPHLSRESNVLELACGTGQLSLPLAPKVKCWEATDFSPAMIDAARARNHCSRLRFSVRDATALPYGNATFDAVVIANALHIMPSPDRALSEIRRVLKDDGILLAPTFLRPTSAAGKLRMRIMRLGGFHVFHAWDDREFLDYLSAHGFAVVETENLGGGMMPLCYAAAKKA